MNQMQTHSASTWKARWWQLFFGVVAIMAISSPQYGWTLFTFDLPRILNATLPQVQVTFAILMVAKTFLSPFQGYLIDKFGPRTLLSCGATLVYAVTPMRKKSAAHGEVLANGQAGFSPLATVT